MLIQSNAFANVLANQVVDVKNVHRLLGFEQNAIHSLCHTDILTKCIAIALWVFYGDDHFQIHSTS